MKITSLISASAMVLALAAPVYAQTAPTTAAPTTAAPTTAAPTTAAPTTAAPTTAAPTTAAPTTAAPTTAAPTTAAPAPTGIPAAYVNVPAVQQVNAQLAAQGYTITDVVMNANGSYSVLSTSTTGGLRLITINPATGGVTDTVTAGVPAGTAGVGANGTFDDDGGNDDDNDNGNGNDNHGGNDDDHGNNNGHDDGGNDDDNGNDDD